MQPFNFMSYRQPASLQLFNSMTLSFKCMDAITSFLSSKDETVQTLAWTTLASFLRYMYTSLSMNVAVLSRLFSIAIGSSIYLTWWTCMETFQKPLQYAENVQVMTSQL